MGQFKSSFDFVNQKIDPIIDFRKIKILLVLYLLSLINKFIKEIHVFLF